MYGGLGQPVYGGLGQPVHGGLGQPVHGGLRLTLFPRSGSDAGYAVKFCSLRSGK